MIGWKRACAGMALVLCLMGCAATAAKESAPPRHVIVLIADGCGFKTMEAANLHQFGDPDARQVYERFPVRLAMRTCSADTLTSDPAGYDPGRAWTDFGYVKKAPTDSGAAATAMSTGVKTYDAAIGVDVEKQPLVHCMDVAEDAGLSTGVVTSVPLSHATPAGFIAHNAARSQYAEIAIEMIRSSRAEVIMGCGHPAFDNDGAPRKDAPDYKYVGGPETWEALLAGTAGADVDADGNGQLDDAFHLVQTRAEFQKLRSGPAPKRVVGVAQAQETLQQRRAGDAKAAPGEVPFLPNVPTLPEMTEAALNVLAANPKGFVLMIEGGAVDWANHSNQTGRMIEETQDFNAAVEAVVRWVERHSSWEKALVIVTADHETGYITAPWPDAETPVFPDRPLVNNGKGAVPGLKWNSGSHTNSLVPFFARGAGAEAFVRRAIGTDPVRGAYLDNTAIGAHIKGLFAR